MCVKWNEGGHERRFKTYAVILCSLDRNPIKDTGAIAIAETLKVNAILAFILYVCVPVAHTCSDILSCLVKKSVGEEGRCSGKIID